jgi:hexokinase
MKVRRKRRDEWLRRFFVVDVGGTHLKILLPLD